MNAGLWLCLSAGFLLPYTRINAWGFILGFFMILICASKLRPLHAQQWLGLKLTRADLIRVTFLSVALALVLRLILLRLAAESGLRFDSSEWPPLLRARPVFQVLNEEMLFRAVLLGELARRFGDSASTPSRFKNWKLSVGSAAFFSIAHIGFYLLKDGTLLGFFALWNLFLFSLACNALFLRFGHIGYGYAIHLSWNLTRFGGDFFRGSERLTEGSAFNHLENSPWLSLGITPVVVCLLFCLNRKWLNRERSPAR